jgi:3-oxochol-4-en-24-oyl-CoA dehydrogenase
LAARAVAVALQAAEAAGVMRWCLDCAVSYIKVREQFGRPVGSFQAVKHKAGKLLVSVELAIAAAWDAVRSLNGDPAQRTLAVAGAAVATLGSAIDAAVDAITLLGGIGATWEHDVHLYWRRAMSLAAMTGPTGGWQAELGAAALRTAREPSFALADDDKEFRARVGQIMDEALVLPPDDASGRAHGRPERAVGPRRSHLADAGLVAPRWPAPWGLGATPVQQLVIADEYAKRALTAPSTVIGEWAMAPILAHGTQDQARRFASPTLHGQIVWCQLFSEPGAGSDLAALATRAVKVPGGWRLEGQKVWTSAAHEADWGICLARTDPAAAKHKGLSFFLVDMRSAGIEVRPLRQASGQSEFNEVFMTGVFVPDDCLVGEPGDGWRLTMTTLSSERLSISATMPVSGEPIRSLILADTYCGSRDEALRVLGAVHARAAAVSALQASETLRRIGGGTLEIQLNVIAVRILGLPR